MACGTSDTSIEAACVGNRAWATATVVGYLAIQGELREGGSRGNGDPV